MAGVSDLHAGALLTYSVGSAPLYLALLGSAARSSDTAVDIAAREVSYVGYQRVQVDPADWGTPVGQRLANDTQIDLAPCTGSSALVVAWALMSDDVDGELRWFGDVPAFELDIFDPSPFIPPGLLVLTLT